MKQLYSYSEEWLQQRQALYTAREIHQQPRLWRQLYQQVQQLQPQWQPFLQTLLCQPDLRIVQGVTLYPYPTGQGACQCRQQ